MGKRVNGAHNVGILEMRVGQVIRRSVKWRTGVDIAGGERMETHRFHRREFFVAIEPEDISSFIAVTIRAFCREFS